MRQSWDTLLNETQSLKEQLESLLEMVPQSAKFHKKTQEINKVWKRLQRAVNDVDQFITPVKSVKITSPLLEDAEFKATWQLWKEYLNEQHGIVMRSRAELMGLKRLAEISESKPDVAVKYLEFAISRPTDKNFYKVNELETKTETAEKPTGKTIIKLPPGYQKAPTEKQETSNQQQVTKEL